MTIHKFKRELSKRGLSSYDYLTDESFSIHFSISEYLSRNRIYLEWIMEETYFTLNSHPEVITAESLIKYKPGVSRLMNGITSHLSLGASFFYHYNGEGYHFVFEQSEKMNTPIALLETIILAKSRIIRLPISSVASSLATIADKSICSADIPDIQSKDKFIQSMNREMFLAQSIFNDYHSYRKRPGRKPSWKKQPTSS